MKAENDINIEATQKAIDAIYMLMREFKLQYKNKIKVLENFSFEGKSEVEFFGEYYTKDENFANFYEKLDELGDFIEETAKAYSTNISKWVSEDFYKINSAAINEMYNPGLGIFAKNDSNIEKLKLMTNPEDTLIQQLTGLLQTLPPFHKSLLENLNSISSGIAIADEIIKAHFKNSSLENNQQYRYINKMREQLDNLLFCSAHLENKVMELEEATSGFATPICEAITESLISNIHQHAEECTNEKSQLNRILSELIETQRTSYVRLSNMNKFFVDNEKVLNSMKCLNVTEYTDMSKSIVELEARALTIEKCIMQKLSEEGKTTINSLSFQAKFDIMQMFKTYRTPEFTQSLIRISSSITRIETDVRENNLHSLDEIAKSNNYLNFHDCITYPVIRFFRVNMFIKDIAKVYAEIKHSKNSPLLQNWQQKLNSLSDQFKLAAKEINENTKLNYQFGDITLKMKKKFTGWGRGEGPISALFRWGSTKNTYEDDEDKGSQAKNKGPGK